MNSDLLSSDRQHLSYGGCLEVNGGCYQLFCASLDNHFRFVLSKLVLLDLHVVFSVPSQGLAGKNVSKMAYLCHIGCETLMNQLSLRHSGIALVVAFSVLTLLTGRQEGHPACKKIEWWGAGMVICLERGADLHTAQLMPLPLTVSCFSKIQICFIFLVPAHPGSPGKKGR